MRVILERSEQKKKKNRKKEERNQRKLGTQPLGVFNPFIHHVMVIVIDT